jgi:hypothetical protein
VLVGRACYQREGALYPLCPWRRFPRAVVPGVVLRNPDAGGDPAGITARRLRIQEDDDVEVQVSIRNGGNWQGGYSSDDGGASRRRRPSSPRGAEHSLLSAPERRASLKFIVLIVEARGTDGRYAVVKGGSRQIPVTVR